MAMPMSRGFQGRRVIDPVARHGDHFAHFFERRDDAHFMSGRHAGEDRIQFVCRRRRE
jgi:hypothetical protein